MDASGRVIYSSLAKYRHYESTLFLKTGRVLVNMFSVLACGNMKMIVVCIVTWTCYVVSSN